MEEQAGPHPLNSGGREIMERQVGAHWWNSREDREYAHGHACMGPASDMDSFCP